MVTRAAAKGQICRHGSGLAGRERWLIPVGLAHSESVEGIEVATIWNLVMQRGVHTPYVSRERKGPSRKHGKKYFVLKKGRRCHQQAWRRMFWHRAGHVESGSLIDCAKINY
jgi:hypothetical protein